MSGEETFIPLKQEYQSRGWTRHPRHDRQAALTTTLEPPPPPPPQPTTTYDQIIHVREGVWITSQLIIFPAICQQFLYLISDHGNIATEGSPKSGLGPTLIEWLQGFFIVRSTIDDTAHSRPLISLEHCICTTSMTNIRPGRDSNPVPLSSHKMIGWDIHRAGLLLWCWPMLFQCRNSVVNDGHYFFIQSSTLYSSIYSVCVCRYVCYCAILKKIKEIKTRNIWPIICVTNQNRPSGCTRISVHLCTRKRTPWSI